MSEQRTKYVVYEISSESAHEHNYLFKFSSNSMIEAVKEHMRFKASGIMIFENDEYRKLSVSEQCQLFMQELKSLVESGQQDKLKELLKGTTQPPQELLDFLNKHFKEESVFNIGNPYTLAVSYAGDKSNLVYFSTDAEVLEHRASVMKETLKEQQ